MTAKTLAATAASEHPAGARGQARPARAARLEALGPNWFAGAMGTGIVANAAATLPTHLPGLLGFGEVVWVADALLLAGLLLGALAQLLWHPARARSHALAPAMAPFFGAPPMAMLTVGAGAVLLGRHLIGLRAAVDLDWVLWIAGTLTGLASAVAIPYLMFTRHRLSTDSTFATWLMPIVPPMVSAATGALLLPHVAPGQARATLLLADFAMFGLAGVASFVVITLVWSRLVYHKVGAAVMVPTLWIVLGPLGQSVTAANQLAAAAPGALVPADAAGLRLFALCYGVPVWGFAMLWLVVCVAITVRTVRERLPFALTWWSFTFPVGTVVTGTSGLFTRTASPMFRGVAPVLYGLLVASWATVTIRTALEARSGRLFLAGPLASAADLVVGGRTPAVS